jgi:ketosteroid isomerase-like protein
MIGHIFAFLAGCLLSNTLLAQSIHPDIADGNFVQIAKELDQRHFNAFNNCDLDALMGLYAPDVEFYHDLNGRILNREQFIAAVKRNICGKVQRRLDEPSLEVYPLAKVGLAMSGKHCFSKVNGDVCLQTGRFFMLWKFDGNKWQISRVFSYDHQDVK